MTYNTSTSCSYRNGTIFDEGYNGVGYNLAINVGAWLVLLIVFSFLRKLAWDYGRIALVSRNENKWTTLFYGEQDKTAVGSADSLDTHIREHDKGFCSWISAFLRVKDADILQKSGRDAIQYLSFQRYLLVYMAIIWVLSTVVVIPVNFTGTNGKSSHFTGTNVGVLLPCSPLLWVHAILAVVYLIIAVYFLRHFSANLEFDEDEQVSRTLMVSNISKINCSKEVILQHFQEAYPEAVLWMSSLPTIIHSCDANKRRSVAAEAKVNSVLELKKTGQHPMMRPYRCGRCCCCDFCGCRQVDAIDYYTREEEDLIQKCEEEKVTAYRDPLGMAFITFQSDQTAERVYADFKATCKGAHNPLPSNVYANLNVNDWHVKYAPSPENIYWENLPMSTTRWWIRAVIINTILVVLLFFLTTPTIMIASLDKIQFRKAFEDLHSPVFVQFFPTILLWIFSALLPTLVYYSDQYVGHWTRTAEHHSVMRKTFIFLMLMVLILPSLGLTSAQALFEWFLRKRNDEYRWDCIFLSGNGVFFVNYVITSALIGSALELIRFSELFMFVIQLIAARSSAEKTAVRKSVVWEFQYGNQYAWMLTVFAIIISMSLLCPLITTFGLVYMALKHVVDRYNIFFAYKPSCINKHIHRTAVNYVVISVILLQCTVVFFTALRSTDLQPVFIFSSVALFITLIVFFGRICFGWFKHFSLIRYKHFIESDSSASGFTEPPAKPFVASVLMDLSTETPADHGPSSSYGAIDHASTTSPDQVIPTVQ
ncbi:hypothetical protein ScPMuIL_013905 [Solemya velum]